MRPLTPRQRASSHVRVVAILATFTGLVLLLWPSRTLRSDNFVIYQPTTRAVLPLRMIDHAKYLPVLAVLNAVGKVGAIQEKRDSLKVWFGDTEIELRLNDKRIRLGKTRIALPQPVRKPGTQWLVPTEFLTTALPQLTQQAIEYKGAGNRIFVGDVKPLTFALRLDPASNGARVTVQFSESVTVRTAASNGKWYLYFGDRPVQPLEQSYRFQDPYVSEIHFDDQDGVPKLVITPTASGLNFYPTSAEGGRILLADVLKPPPPAPSQRPPTGESPAIAQGPTPSTTPPDGAGQPVPGVPGLPLPVVVLDPGHGAGDAGARGRDGVREKDLAAQLTARVRLALLATRKYRVQLTRVGDVSLSFEQRETAANTARAAVYLSFHAGDFGNTTPRIAVFSYRGTPPEQPESRPLLTPWNQIQQAHLVRSRQLAHALEERFAQIPGLTADRAAEAPVRALRSIDAPAVAIEIGSLNADQDSGPLTNPSFQQQLATAIAAGLEAFRGGSP